MRPALIIALLFSGAAMARAAALADCWAERKHGHQAEAQACFESLTRSGDAYARAEGLWGLEKWEQANEQFRVAAQGENGKPLYKVRWGMLLHERFNDGEAADLFREALAKDPTNAEAYLGLAIVSAENFSTKAREYALKAVELNPGLGQEHEPYKELQLSYKNGYRDAATVNSLRLLDSYKNFVTARGNSAILKLNTNESDLLLPYLEEEVHTILATYEQKYRLKLPAPV